MTEFISVISLITSEGTASDFKPDQAKLSQELEPLYDLTPLYSTQNLGVEAKEVCRTATEIDDANPERFPTTLDARLQVPEPGTKTNVLFNDFGLQIELQSRVSIKETRELPSPWLKAESTQALVKQFQMTRKTQFCFNVADNTRVLFVSNEEQKHYFFGPGIQHRALPGGRYTVQVKGGLSHTQSMTIVLPAIRAEEHLDLKAYANYRLMNATGMLQRVATASVIIPGPEKFNHRNNTPHICPPTLRNVFEYFPRSAQVPNKVKIEDEIEANAFSLPAGRYESHPKNLSSERCLALNLYPSRTAKAEYRGQSVILTPRIDGTYRGHTAGPANNAQELVLHPNTATVIVRDAEDANPQSRSSESNFKNKSTQRPVRIFRFNLQNRTG